MLALKTTADGNEIIMGDLSISPLVTRPNPIYLLLYHGTGILYATDLKIAFHLYS